MVEDDSLVGGFFLIRPAPTSRNILRRRCEPNAHLLHLAASTLSRANRKNS